MVYADHYGFVPGPDIVVTVVLPGVGAVLVGTLQWGANHFGGCGCKTHFVLERWRHCGAHMEVLNSEKRALCLVQRL